MLASGQGHGIWGVRGERAELYGKSICYDIGGKAVPTYILHKGLFSSENILNRVLIRLGLNN